MGHKDRNLYLTLIGGSHVMQGHHSLSIGKSARNLFKIHQLLHGYVTNIGSGVLSDTFIYHAVRATPQKAVFPTRTLDTLGAAYDTIWIQFRNPPAKVERKKGRFMKEKRNKQTKKSYGQKANFRGVYFHVITRTSS